MEVLPGPLPDGRRSGGDEGLGSRLSANSDFPFTLYVLARHYTTGGTRPPFFPLRWIRSIVFLSLPLSNSFVSDIQYDLNEEKVQKVAKNMRWMCSLASCVADYAPPLNLGTVLCTHKRDFATVTLIPGRCFDRGGGVSDFTTIEGRRQTSVFFRSPLDQKEAIGVVFRSMDPSGNFRAAQS